MSDNYRDLQKQLLSAGFTMRHSKHLIFTRGPHIVVLPHTPSGRSYQNDKARVRRVIRASQEKQ